MGLELVESAETGQKNPGRGKGGKKKKNAVPLIFGD